jgi:hypothetical protein
MQTKDSKLSWTSIVNFKKREQFKHHTNSILYDGAAFSDSSPARCSRSSQAHRNSIGLGMATGTSKRECHPVPTPDIPYFSRSRPRSP